MTVLPNVKYDDRVDPTALLLDWYMKPQNHAMDAFYRRLTEAAAALQTTTSRSNGLGAQRMPVGTYAPIKGLYLSSHASSMRQPL